MNTKDEIAQVLKSALKVAEVEVRDDSGLHAGHKQAGGGGHYAVIVVSDLFQDKSLIERHRMVNEAVFGALQEKVHALAIKAMTLNEWQQKKGS